MTKKPQSRSPITLDDQNDGMDSSSYHVCRTSPNRHPTIKAHFFLKNSQPRYVSSLSRPPQKEQEYRCSSTFPSLHQQNPLLHLQILENTSHHHRHHRRRPRSRPPAHPRHLSLHAKEERAIVRRQDAEEGDVPPGFDGAGSIDV